MVRIGAWPGPTAELCTPVVVEGLHDLRPGVHDERSMLSDRLTDRATLEQHELDAGVACNQGKVLAGHHGGAGASADRLTAVAVPGSATLWDTTPRYGALGGRLD